MQATRTTAWQNSSQRAQRTVKRRKLSSQLVVRSIVQLRR